MAVYILFYFKSLSISSVLLQN